MIDRHLFEEDFEPYRIKRFVFDQPTLEGPATVTVTLEDDERTRVMEITIAEPEHDINDLEAMIPPYLEVVDNSSRGWDSPPIQVEHPHGGGVYFHASGMRELAPV